MEISSSRPERNLPSRPRGGKKRARDGGRDGGRDGEKDRGRSRAHVPADFCPMLV
jgi:hypothetical protein